MKPATIIDEAPALAGASVVTQSTVESIVAARDASLRTMDEAVSQMSAGWDLADAAADLKSKAAAGAVFTLRDRTREDDYKRIFRGNFDRVASMKTFREELDASVWQGLFERTGLFDLMDHTAREEWRKTLMNDVPEVTVDNVLATMESVGRDAHLIFRRGIAKAFIALDRRFRSHDGFKIGSRIIFTGAFNTFGSMSYGRTHDMIIDVERVFAKLDGQAPNPRGLFSQIDADRGRGFSPRQSVTEADYFRIKGFMNGNAHLWFTRDDLVEKVNKLLAEYYGEVIPDGVSRGGSADDLKPKAGLPAKNLQYYFTPLAAAEHVLREHHIPEGARVLEPSAGTGHLVRPMLERGARVDAVEIDPARVAALRLIRSTRLKVTEANFLQMHPNPVYDFVVMNPPFYGTHWMEHVTHAFEFLAPGGTLIAILPASAEDGESAKHQAFRAWEKKSRGCTWGRPFRDMPAESFAEAGTYINTVLFEIRKRSS